MFLKKILSEVEKIYKTKKLNKYKGIGKNTFFYEISNCFNIDEKIVTIEKNCIYVKVNVKKCFINDNNNLTDLIKCWDMFGILACSNKCKWEYNDGLIIMLNNNILIGEDFLILKGVKIIKSGVFCKSVVTKYVPSFPIVVGNPLKNIKRICEDKNAKK